MQVEHTRSATRSLSSVCLHIESVLPSASYDARKAVSSSEVPNRDDEEEQEAAQMHEPSHHHHDHAWTEHQIADRLGWMARFKPNKKGGIVFLDNEALKKQQGVVKDIMLQVGSQLLTGKLAVRISLPIRIFEPRTLLERVADGWNYAPTLLKKAALASEPLERMKLVMAFVVGGFHFCVGQLKPFNPILGETYEATYPDGTQIFMEHVAHHPVQSAFHVRGPRGLYEISGVYEFESVSSRNSIFNHQIGKTTIRFHDGHVVSYTLPQIKMSGVLFGERVVEIAGLAKFDDLKHELAGEINFDAHSGGFLFGKTRQADDVKGHIVSTRRGAKGAAQNHIVAIQGSWLTHLQCDGKVYWHVESEPAFLHRPVENPLPSDCRFREDLRALQQGNPELAQSEKLRLEGIQRSDSRLRDPAQQKNTKRRTSKCGGY